MTRNKWSESPHQGLTVGASRSSRFAVELPSLHLTQGGRASWCGGEKLLAVALILIGVTFRFLPHPANVAPIAAVALFAGVMLRARIAWIVPLVAMIISDAVIGFHTLIPFTWGCFVLTIFIGRWVRRKTNILSVIGGSLAGSVLFYVVTNAAVWALTPLYEKTLSGLFQSYVMALPFFRNTILGDLFFTGMLFGLYAFAILAVRAGKTQSSLTKQA